MIKPVFFLGIVRSGSTFVGDLLTKNNSNVYITHESDIIWILYNLYELKTPVDDIEKYQWDSLQAMGDTLKRCKHELKKWKDHTPTELYEICQRLIMNSGTSWQRLVRGDTIYLGDKKPTQQSDPAIFKWTEENIIDPKPKYIHLIRHPNDFLESTLHFGKTVKLWGDTNNEIMEFWVKKQQETLELTKDIPERAITVKYETICEFPKVDLEKIYKFLGVPLEGSTPSGVKKASFYEKADFDYPKGYVELLEKFEYKEK
jgi:hypothetical protein